MVVEHENALLITDRAKACGDNIVVNRCAFGAVALDERPCGDYVACALGPTLSNLWYAA